MQDVRAVISPLTYAESRHAALAALHSCSVMVGGRRFSHQQSSLATDDLAQCLDLLLVLDKPFPGPHDTIDDLKDTPESTRCTFDLHKAGN
jgi:hypothetical protein